MNNGCICCTVRGDLIHAFEAIAKRKKKVDHVIIETTGLADPGPVAQTFFADDAIKAFARLDGIVTLVDAKHVEQHLDDKKADGAVNEAEQQVAFADRLLLNKVDLVSDADLARAARLRHLNMYAPIARCENAAVAMEAVIGIRAFELSRMLEQDPAFLGDPHGHGRRPRRRRRRPRPRRGLRRPRLRPRARPRRRFGGEHEHGHAAACDVDGCDDAAHHHAHGHFHDTSVTSVGIERAVEMDILGLGERVDQHAAAGEGRRHLPDEGRAWRSGDGGRRTPSAVVWLPRFACAAHATKECSVLHSIAARAATAARRPEHRQALEARASARGREHGAILDHGVHAVRRHESARGREHLATARVGSCALVGPLLVFGRVGRHPSKRWRLRPRELARTTTSRPERNDRPGTCGREERP